MRYRIKRGGPARAMGRPAAATGAPHAVPAHNAPSTASAPSAAALQNPYARRYTPARSFAELRPPHGGGQPPAGQPPTGHEQSL